MSWFDTSNLDVRVKVIAAVLSAIAALATIGINFERARQTFGKGVVTEFLATAAIPQDKWADFTNSAADNEALPPEEVVAARTFKRGDNFVMYFEINKRRDDCELSGYQVTAVPRATGVDVNVPLHLNTPRARPAGRQNIGLPHKMPSDMPAGRATMFATLTYRCSEGVRNERSNAVAVTVTE